MKSWKWPSAAQWTAWSLQASLLLVSIAPILPPGTPAWVPSALQIGAVCIGVFTHKIGHTTAPKPVRVAAVPAATEAVSSEAAVTASPADSSEAV